MTARIACAIIDVYVKLIERLDESEKLTSASMLWQVLTYAALCTIKSNRTITAIAVFSVFTLSIDARI